MQSIEFDFPSFRKMIFIESAFDFVFGAKMFANRILGELVSGLSGFGLFFRELLSRGTLLGVGLALAACTDPTLRSPESYLLSYEVREPSPNRVFVCHAYECALKTGVSLFDEDIATIRAMMEPGKENAQAERAAIAKTIGWMERRVASETGTADDRDYRDLLSGGDATQLDCIDEASNATSYMMLFRQLGLLNHHTIGYPIAKGFLLDGRYPHVTAVVIERETGEEFSIDSWVFANGETAAVSPLKVWLTARSADVYRSRYPSGEKES